MGGAWLDDDEAGGWLHRAGYVVGNVHRLYLDQLYLVPTHKGAIYRYIARNDTRVLAKLRQLPPAAGALAHALHDKAPVRGPSFAGRCDAPLAELQAPGAIAEGSLCSRYKKSHLAVFQPDIGAYTEALRPNDQWPSPDRWMQHYLVLEKDCMCASLPFGPVGDRVWRWMRQREKALAWQRKHGRGPLAPKVPSDLRAFVRLRDSMVLCVWEEHEDKPSMPVLEQLDVCDA